MFLEKFKPIILHPDGLAAHIQRADVAHESWPGDAISAQAERHRNNESAKIATVHQALHALV
jgi:hypothetical protein